MTFAFLQPDPDTEQLKNDLNANYLWTFQIKNSSFVLLKTESVTTGDQDMVSFKKKKKRSVISLKQHLFLSNGEYKAEDKVIVLC